MHFHERKIVCGGSCVHMLRTEDAALNREHFPLHLLRLDRAALIQQTHGKKTLGS